MIVPLKYYLPNVMCSSKTKALKLLRDGFKDEFCEFVGNSEEFDQLLMELADEFVSNNIPLTDEDDQNDMALLLRNSVYSG